MKQCSKCNQQYDDRIQYCFRDGMTLEQSTSTVKALHLDKITENVPVPSTAFDTDTLDISISDILDIQALSMDIGFDTMSNTQEQQVSGFVPSGSISNDIEDIVLQSNTASSVSLDTSDIDTVDFHMDDFENSVPSVATGQSVGQALVTQTLDMDEGFLPGDTFDLPVNDVYTEEVKRKAMQSGTGARPVTPEQWQQSGPIMEEALKQAKEQRAQIKMDPSAPVSPASTKSTVSSTNAQTVAPSSSGFPKMLIASIAVILVAGLFFFMGSGAPKTSKATNTSKPNLQVPAINSTIPVQKVPVQDVPSANSNTEDTEPVNGVDVENPDTLENIEDGVNTENDTDPEAPSTIDGVDGIEKTPDTQKGTEGTSTEPSNTESTNNIQQVTPLLPPNTHTPVESSKEQLKKEPTPKEPTTTTPSASSSVQSTQQPATQQPATQKPATQKEGSVTKSPEAKNTEVQKTTTKVEKTTEKKADPPKNTTQATQTVSWGAPVECFVVFNANVSSAKVFVDGVEKGAVGKKLSVDCGDHKAEVKATGYKTHTRNISVNGTSTFTIDLPKE